MSDIDDYLKSVKPSQKVVLERIRKVIKQAVPDAAEMISYGVPTFKYNKRPLIYFAAFKDHMSIYPTSDEMISKIGEELAKFRTGKGTLQFTEEKPISGPLVQKIVNFRLAEMTKN